MRRIVGGLPILAGSAGFAVAIGLLGAPASPGAADLEADSVGRRGIQERLEHPAGLRLDARPVDPRALARFYRPRGFAPAWDAGEGGSERAAELLRALASAEAHGLDTERYHLGPIRAGRAREGDTVRSSSICS